MAQNINIMKNMKSSNLLNYDNNNDNDITLVLRMLLCEYVHMRVNITDIHCRLYNRLIVYV